MRGKDQSRSKRAFPLDNIITLMAGGDTTKIPDRLFFRIGDVGEIADVEPYVLRYWETEFPQLSPKKTSGGQRQYRRKDVEMVLAIKELLYKEGYTIAGARKTLHERFKKNRRFPPARERSAPPFEPQSTETPAVLTGIKRELNDILVMLSQR